MLNSQFLRRNLVWPLSGATFVTFALAVFVPAGGLFVNLGTTLLGILLTVGYVDLILREHRAIRRAGVSARIREQIYRFATVASSQFRTAFAFTPEVYDEQAVLSSDDGLRRAETARVAKEILRPAAAQRIAAMDTTAWKRLNDQLRIAWNGADRLLELYGSQLAPETIEMLTDAQDRMRAITDRYRTFFDILGIPDEELKPKVTGESSVPLKRALESATVADVQAVLDLSVQLFAYLDRVGGKVAAA